MRALPVSELNGPFLCPTHLTKEVCLESNQHLCLARQYSHRCVPVFSPLQARWYPYKPHSFKGFFMPILETTLNSDSSNEGLAADVRALKIAVALLVTRIPLEHKPYAVCDALNNSGESSASELADLIKQFLDKAHNRT
ncbi:hypothetical protein D6N31_11725 [Salmonella enterica]|nr:hypothetical protein [Salmonella enterica]